MAHLSGDKSLVEAFARGEDVHRHTAAEVFDTPHADVSSDQRRVAKVINFGLIYGMSAFGLSQNLAIERSAAQSYMDKYFARYPGVAAYMERTRHAARRLADGGLVAFPTETVYGLGADAANASAVARIFALKGRPADHPVIVHVADIRGLAEWSSSVPRSAIALAETFWPGPLTLIVAKSPRVPSIVTGGQSSVGIRCPSHPVARDLLREFTREGSGAIAAPSANRFGHVSPTTADHVRDEFGAAVPILDGGACEVGLESTIVDLSRGRPVLLRPGGISRAQIEAVLGEALRDRDADAPRASGTLAAHYA